MCRYKPKKDQKKRCKHVPQRWLLWRHFRRKALGYVIRARAKIHKVEAKTAKANTNVTQDPPKIKDGFSQLDEFSKR